jgi:cell division protein FtsQ
LILHLTVPRLAAGALVAVCLAAPFWGPPVLRELDIFRVERTEVSGVHLLAPHEVLSASGIRPEHSVWDDPEEWIEALRAHPVVRDAVIERSLPRTLLIRIEERRPVALVEAGLLRPATAEGEVLPVDPTRAQVDLPLVRISGLDAATSRVEEEADRMLLGEAGRLAQLDPALLARVSEIRRAPSGDLVLLLSQPAVELLLPPGAGPERLRQLRAVLDDIEHRAEAGSAGHPAARVRVDVRYEDQVVVRFPSSS